MVTRESLGRIGIVLGGALLAAALAVGLVWAVPHYTALGFWQTLAVAVIVVGGVAGAGRFAGRVFPAYDVAEVEVDDVITRDGDRGGLPVGGGAVSANDVVDRIERADDDDSVEALVVTLNTPGGAPVPSEDIRAAAAAFDGPTVAYAEDTAASGGYLIACGCDEFHARHNSIVGSIGVTFAHLGRSDLAEKVGLDYRRIVAGDYKDSGSPWRDLREDERAYFQDLVDDQYDDFVETVVADRGLDEGTVRETEARVYLGSEAAEAGLVDTVGPREEMEERLAERIGVDEITVESFEPEHGLTDRVGMSARSVARAFGAGVASTLVGDDGPGKLRL